MNNNLRIERLDTRTVRVMLSRPERNNAFDEHLIAALHAAFDRIAVDRELATVVLAGEGKNFCAGGDLDWMRRAAGFSHAENLADANGLAAMLAALDDLPQTVVACVQGAAYAGATGLIACSDIVLAADNAQFCFSEVKLGLIPAVISPYVIRAMGARAARRYFLSAEVFGAAEAHRLGLVHEVVPPTQLASRCDDMLAALRAGAPGAKANTKKLIAQVAAQSLSPALRALTAQTIADQRATPEAREGLSAFFDKRKPSWSNM